MKKFTLNLRKENTKIEFSYLDDIEVCLPYSDLKNIKEYFINNKKFLSNMPDNINEFDIKTWNYILNNTQEFYENIDEIIIEKVADLPIIVEQLPNVRNKRIVIEEVLTFDNYDRFVQLNNNYQNFQLMVFLKYNLDIVELNTGLRTLEKIMDIGDQIKNYNLSPFEQAMIVFDYSRNRIYQKESADEPKTLSRSLSSVLFNKPIVCVGFAAIVNSLLDYLNISSSPVHLYSDNSGHAINSIYINDRKYTINGLYFIDATNNSKKVNTNWYECYSCFLKTFASFDEIYHGRYHNMNDECFHFETYENLWDSNEVYKIENNYIKLCKLYGSNASFNQVRYIVDDEYQKKIKNRINILTRFANKPIPEKTYLCALATIIPYERELIHNTYQYNYDRLFDITNKSGWNKSHIKEHFVTYLNDELNIYENEQQDCVYVKKQINC